MPALGRKRTIDGSYCFRKKTDHQGPMSEGQITLAESYFFTGRAYVTGAHAIVKSPVRQRYANDFRFVFPCMSLMAHAIEVYLKAWLSVHGYNDETLRKRFRHDLRSLYNEARTTGLQEPHTREGETIHDLVESFEVQHEPPYPLRYPFNGWQIPLPKLNIVFQIFVRLDRIIADKLDKAVPADLDWRVAPDEDLRSS